MEIGYTSKKFFLSKVECQTNFWFELGHSVLPDLFLVWLFFCIFPVVFSRLWGYNQEKCMDF